VVVAQGDIWWADLGQPDGSAPGFRRPVLVVQCDAFNRSRIGTIVGVALTSQLKWADAPGNVLLKSGSTGLDRDSVANVSQIVTVGREMLTERVGRVSERKLEQVLSGIGLVIGR
jgi:mRNA interferase MazF